jgi:hypothetical protein
MTIPTIEGDLRDVIISTIAQHRGTDVSAGDLSDAILSAIRSHFAKPGAVTALLRFREQTGAGAAGAFEPIDPLGDARKAFWDYLRERKAQIRNPNMLNNALDLAVEAGATAALQKME